MHAAVVSVVFTRTLDETDVIDVILCDLQTTLEAADACRTSAQQQTSHNV